MSLSARRTVFGVHSVTAYNRTNGLPYGLALIVQSGQFSLEGDTIGLKGGSNKYDWALEDGDIEAELTFAVSEYPNWLFEVFGGKAPTQGAAEASGNVSTLVDKKGTSVVAAAGLLGTATVTTAADLKTGKYVVKATAADAFKVYCLSNIDFGRGTDADFTDDTLEIFAKTGATANEVIAITGFGFSLTMGASAPAMVADDTAVFEVRAVNTVNRIVKIGGIADITPEFGAVIYAQKSGSGAIFEIEAYKMKAVGLGLGAERKTFSENEYAAKASYDSVEDAVCRIREVE
jgi:hypothetical protein